MDVVTSTCGAVYAPNMTDAAVFKTELQDSVEAGKDLGRSILDHFDERLPDAVVLFASPVYSPELLLSGLDTSCSPGAVVGGSSAGEFTFEGTSASSAVALALRSDNLRFNVHVARDVRTDVHHAATTFATSFDPEDDPDFPHRTVLLLMDVLAGYGEEFLKIFTEATSGRYQVFGGGAADDAAFEETFVFAGRNAMSDAAVGLEIRSRQPMGIGVSHGWTPFSHTMTATAASGLKLVELDGAPAADVIESFAREHDLSFDRDEPLSFFLHHVLGIEEAGEDYKLRVPLEVEEDGSLICAAEIPLGAKVRVMRTRHNSAAEAASVAARRARMKLRTEGVEPGAALFLDCAATRLRLGDKFGASVDQVVESLGTTMCVGCNTYGQFARVEGQFSGFHNCTAVVGAFPE